MKSSLIPIFSAIWESKFNYKQQTFITLHTIKSTSPYSNRQTLEKRYLLPENVKHPHHPQMAPSLIFAILFFLSVSRPEDRAHGLDHESPVILSPEMYAYFHPNTQPPSTNNLCNSPHCSSQPLAANVHSNTAHEAERAMAAGGIAGIPVGFIFAILITAAIYYVAIKRQDNAHKAKTQPQLEV